MKPIKLPKHYNYIEAYLTYRCPLNCSYCINKQLGLNKVSTMHYDSWIKGLNRIKTTEDLPITIGGGEPTSHHSFYDIVN